MITAIIAIPLLGFVGLGIDLTRAYIVQVRLQGAVDTAALAAAGLNGQSSDEIKKIATNYFYANYPLNSWAPPATPVITFDNQTVHVTAQAMVKNYFLRLFGHNTFTVATQASAISQGKGAEVAMVLDVTGSMGEYLDGVQKLQSLKNASNDLLNILFGTSDTSDHVKVGIVPFAASVRVDPATAVANGWIDTTGQSEWARINFANNTTTTTSSGGGGGGGVGGGFGSGGFGFGHGGGFGFGGGSSGSSGSSGGTTTTTVDVPNNYAYAMYTQYMTNTPWVGCVEARPTPTSGPHAGIHLAETDDPPDPSDPDTLWVPFFNPDNPGSGSSSHGGFGGFGGFGGYPNDYLPDIITTGSDLQKQTYAKKYVGQSASTTSLSSAKGVDRQCVPVAIQPLTNDKTTLTNIISGLQADGNTHVPLGIAWGWRVLSHDPPYTQGVAYSDDNWDKFLIIETDGTNTMPGDNVAGSINKSEYTAYGFAAQQRLGSGVNSTSKMVSAINDSMTRVCDNIKAVKKPDGTPAITVFTIGFGSEAAQEPMKTLLQNCASEPDYFFSPQNGGDLEAAFSDIANQITKIRLTQ